MSTTDFHHSPPWAADILFNDDKEEYEEIEEEIEMEEEIEVEEEIEEELEEVEEDADKEEEEEEEEGGGGGGGGGGGEGEEDEEVHGPTDSLIAEENERNDVSHDIESEVQDEGLRSGLPIAITNEATVLPGIDAVKGDFRSSGPPDVLIKNAKWAPRLREGSFHCSSLEKHLLSSDGCNNQVCRFHTKDTVALAWNDIPVHVQKEHSFPSLDTSSNLDNFKSMDLEHRQLLPGVAMGKIGTADPLHNDKEVNDVSHSIGEGEKSEMQSNKDLNPKALRSSVPQVKPSALSPSADYKDVNKRPAMLCDFFAKGWCIKGSSCRFIHKRDHVSNSSQKLGVIEASAESDLQSDIGTGDVAEGLKMTTSQDQHDLVGGKCGSLASHSLEAVLLSCKHEKDKCTWLERGISSPGLSSDSQRSSFWKDGSRFSLIKDTGGDIPRINCSVDQYDRDLSATKDSPVLQSGSFSEYRSVKGGFSGSVLSSYKIGQEDVTAKQNRYMLKDYTSLSNCSLNHHSSCSPLKVDTFGNKENSVVRSSFLHDSSTFSGSSFKELQLFSEYKTKFVPYNWEPSVPFRASLLIPSLSASSSGCQYDPLHDSIEQPVLGSTSFRLFPSSQGSLFHDSLQRTNPTAQCSDCKLDRNSVEFHQMLGDSTWDKNSSGHSKHAPVVEAESAATSATEKSVMPIEVNPEGFTVKDAPKENRMNSDSDPKIRSDRVRDKKEAKVDKGREAVEMDVDNEMIDEDMNRELKAVKHFRAALIESVKELMKPIWHQGRLTKGAYKTIVQKTEEKVIFSLLPNQIPNTSDLVRQYLTSCQPKIQKLVEGYVEKYGKL
ncbi:hsp70 nucleotide exchange factor fes1, variant 2 [Ancistrocladus abbreviatus]